MAELYLNICLLQRWQGSTYPSIGEYMMMNNELQLLIWNAAVAVSYVSMIGTENA